VYHDGFIFSKPIFLKYKLKINGSKNNNTKISNFKKKKSTDKSNNFVEVKEEIRRCIKGLCNLKPIVEVAPQILISNFTL